MRSAQRLQSMFRQCGGWLVLAASVPLFVCLLCQLVLAAATLLLLLLFALCLARFWLPEESRLVHALVCQALQRSKTEAREGPGGKHAMQPASEEKQ